MIRALLGDGHELGISLSYAEQPRPEGDCPGICDWRWLHRPKPGVPDPGDNIFLGTTWSTIWKRSAGLTTGAEVYAYHVHDPERYGVIEFDATGKAISIEEKPRARARTGR